MLSKNRIKELQQLHLRKHRDATKQFVVEGVKSVLEVAAEMPEIIVSVYAVPEFLERHHSEFAQTGITIVGISETELTRISMQPSPNQVFAVCRYFEPKKFGARDQHFTFYLDDIRDPGNLGTILRIADWFGVKKIFCSPETCELYNPKTLQASMGSFLLVGAEYITLKKLAGANNPGEIYGTTLDGKDLFSEELKPGIIVIGNEANGIQPENLALVTKRLTIPSAPGVRTESLNAAMAAAIIAAEFFRRKNA